MERYNLIVKPSKISGVITAPPSKSFAHRILICAYLSGKKIKVLNAGDSVDVKVTLNALKTLGALIVEDKNEIIISKGELPKNEVIINCNESGSSLRFLMPIVCALGVKATFTGSKRLLERPISELVSSLNENGAKIHGFSVDGKLTAKRYEIDGSVSSQYVSGLLLALSYLDGESEVIIKNGFASKPYVDITLSVLTDFGVNVKEIEGGYKIIGGYNTKKTVYTVEGDWSGSAFILSMGAINGSVKVKGLNPNSTQGDKKILEILSKFGAKVEICDDEIKVSNSKLNGISVDMDDVPDLIQTVSAVACFSNGKTVISGVDRLRLKESDRISAILDSLQSVGVNARYENDCIIIVGKKPTGAKIDGKNDHRTVMSGAVLGVGASGQIEITCGEAISKSYPNFVSDYKELGGSVDVVVKR